MADDWADDDDERADAVRRAELAAFAGSWQLLGLMAVVHLWPPVLRPGRRPGSGGSWWRCACGTRRRPLRRVARAVRGLVMSGLVWLGLSGAALTGAGLTPQTLVDVRRWCDSLGDPPVPCCPHALDRLRPRA